MAELTAEEPVITRTCNVVVYSVSSRVKRMKYLRTGRVNQSERERERDGRE